MQSFTKTEIKWIISELAAVAERADNQSKLVAATPMERSFLKLKSENLISVSEKLTRALEDGDKRIRIV
jgi:hypothetical protein